MRKPNILKITKEEKMKQANSPLSLSHAETHYLHGLLSAGISYPEAMEIVETQKNVINGYYLDGVKCLAQYNTLGRMFGERILHERNKNKKLPKVVVEKKK